jgi:hypothetical protein
MKKTPPSVPDQLLTFVITIRTRLLKVAEDLGNLAQRTPPTRFHASLILAQSLAKEGAV